MPNKTDQIPIHTKVTSPRTTGSKAFAVEFEVLRSSVVSGDPETYSSTLLIIQKSDLNSRRLFITEGIYCSLLILLRVNQGEVLVDGLSRPVQIIESGLSTSQSI